MKEVVVCINGNDYSRGYFSYINQAIRGLSAYYVNKTPIYIDFTNESSYSQSPNDNIFEYFFEQPFIKKSELTDYTIKELAVWISDIQFKSSIEVSEKDYELGRKVFKDFIRIKADVIDEFNKVYEPHKTKKILGIHRRGTDYGVHGNIVPLEKIFESVDEHIGKYDALFLATEEQSTLDSFKERYNNLIYLPAFRANGTKSVFHLEYNKINMAKEVLFDAIFLSKCDTILKTVSNVSDFAIFAGHTNYIRIQKEYTYK